MRTLKLTAVALACIATAASAQGPVRSGTLMDFRGNYAIERGRGSVRISEALGGSYSEWSMTMNQPSHEMRMFVGALASNGSFRVWRFEQEPAPLVAHEGTARFDGQDFIADFPSDNGPSGKMIRERWRLTPGGGLEFALEASGSGETPRRVGGFTATRQ